MAEFSGWPGDSVLSSVSCNRAQNCGVGGGATHLDEEDSDDGDHGNNNYWLSVGIT